MRKAQEERDRFEKKYNEKRQTLRELERTTNSTIQDNEREIAVLKEKILSSENKTADSIQQKDEEIQKLKSKLSDAKSKMSEGTLVLEEELNKTKNDLTIIEREKTEISQAYEKDKMLWESERNFQEERIQKAKAELQENQHKLEATINQLQKKPVENKNAANHHEIYSQAQAECQSQISELKKNHESLVSELKEKCVNSEKNLKELQEKYEILRWEASSDKSSYEKWLNDVSSFDKRLQSEIETLKEERDRRMLEHQEAL